MSEKIKDKSVGLAIYGEDNFNSFYQEEDIKERYAEDKKDKERAYEDKIERIEEKYQAKRNKLFNKHEDTLDKIKESFDKKLSIAQEEININFLQAEEIDFLIERQKESEGLEILQQKISILKEDAKLKDVLIKELNKRLTARIYEQKEEEDKALKGRVLMSLGMDINSLQNDESQENKLCGVLLPQVKTELLGGFAWSFSKKEKKDYPSYFIELVEGKLACKIAAAINLAAANQLLLHEKYKALLAEAKFLDIKNSKIV
jgi:hypothetical protein